MAPTILKCFTAVHCVCFTIQHLCIAVKLAFGNHYGSKRTNAREHYFELSRPWDNTEVEVASIKASQVWQYGQKAQNVKFQRVSTSEISASLGIVSRQHAAVTRRRSNHHVCLKHLALIIRFPCTVKGFTKHGDRLLFPPWSWVKANEEGQRQMVSSHKSVLHE